jgi:hypothetical protein
MHASVNSGLLLKLRVSSATARVDADLIGKVGFPGAASPQTSPTEWPYALTPNAMSENHCGRPSYEFSLLSSYDWRSPQDRSRLYL